MSTRDHSRPLRRGPVSLSGKQPEEKWPVRKTLFFVILASFGLWLGIVALALLVFE